MNGYMIEIFLDGHFNGHIAYVEKNVEDALNRAINSYSNTIPVSFGSITMVNLQDAIIEKWEGSKLVTGLGRAAFFGGFFFCDWERGKYAIRCEKELLTLGRIRAAIHSDSHTVVFI